MATEYEFQVSSSGSPGVGDVMRARYERFLAISGMSPNLVDSESDSEEFEESTGSDMDEWIEISKRIDIVSDSESDDSVVEVGTSASVVAKDSRRTSARINSESTSLRFSPRLSVKLQAKVELSMAEQHQSTSGIKNKQGRKKSSTSFTQRSSEHPGCPKHFRCPLEKCHKVFLSANSLRKHQKIHSDLTREYVCLICPMRYHKQKTLKAHYTIDHGGIKRFLFNEVYASRALESAPALPPQLTRSESKIFSCPICSWKFRTRSKQQLHLKTHSDLTCKYVCGMCKTRYKTVTALKIHLTVKHPAGSLEKREK